MSELIERVALAIAKCADAEWGDRLGMPPDAYIHGITSCRALAHAAIKAMREPSHEMIAAMVHDHDIQGVVYLRGPSAYKAGIDAALKE